VKRIADAEANEKEHVRALVQGWPRGTLILADLGHSGFARFGWLIDNGSA